MELRSRGREFDPRLGRGCVTTLGKSFTPSCLDADTLRYYNRVVKPGTFAFSSRKTAERHFVNFTRRGEKSLIRTERTPRIRHCVCITAQLLKSLLATELDERQDPAASLPRLAVDARPTGNGIHHRIITATTTVSIFFPVYQPQYLDTLHATTGNI